LYLFFFTFLGLEIILRIYNPFHFRIKGDQLLLPVNERLVIKNTINPRLDPVIVNTRNSMGFRGPGKPGSFEHVLSIITVGGSTTECHFLSDTNTWPWLLGEDLTASFRDVWVNNAGLDGHSTFGHEILLDDYLVKLKPKVILFLTGINDMENDQPTFHDKQNRKGAYNDFGHFIFNNSEVLNLSLNLWRGWKARRLNNTTERLLDLRGGTMLVIPPQQVAERIVAQAKYLAGYRQRVLALIDTCKAHGIKPVFMTQPNLFGEGRDSVTGINLETFKLGDGLNGKELWEMLEVYNNALKDVARENKVPVIDLAALMPKNSLYFYDASHFTNEGAAKIASLVAAGLQPVLDDCFPGYRK
jgi:lysophospholipase L1-like esterase